MFRFEYISTLQYLWLIIPLIALLYLGWRMEKSLVTRLGNPTLLFSLQDGFGKRLKMALRILPVTALLFCMVAWANPQWGHKREIVESKSADIFVAFDISNSMLAEDIAPNRLEKARRFASLLVDELKGERIGLIFFAGNAFLQMPLTNDYAAGKMLLQTADPSMAGVQGTAIKEAISVALKSYDPNSSQHKALIIITDGEDHEEGVDEMINEAIENNFSIHTVGVGSDEGAFIPIRTSSGEDWKRDQNGKPVKSRYNESVLRKIADKGNGGFYHLNNERSIISELRNQIATLEKRAYEHESFTDFNSYFQLFLSIALVLILVEWMMHNVFIHFKNNAS